MKKNILIVFLSFLFLFGFTACDQKQTMEDIIKIFETEASVVIDRTEKPFYESIGASDGVIFYIDNSPVKLYEYSSEKAFKKAMNEYGDIIKDFPRINLTFLDTNSEDAKNIFISISDRNSLVSSDNSHDTSGNVSSNISVPEVEQPKKNKLIIGDIITIDDWEITLNSFYVTDSIKNSEYTSYEADEGSKYVVVDLTVKNLGTKANTFVEYISLTNEKVTCKIIYQNKYEYSSTNLLAYDNDLHHTTLNPLESYTGILAYSVVDEAAQSNELSFQVYFGKDVYTYDLEQAATVPQAQSNEDSSVVSAQEFSEVESGFITLDELDEKHGYYFEYGSELEYYVLNYRYLVDGNGYVIPIYGLSKYLVLKPEDWEATFNTIRMYKRNNIIYVNENDVLAYFDF